MPKLSLHVLLLLCASVLLTMQVAVAGNFAVNLDDNGVALKGHDPVTYFTDGKPTMGSAEYTASADGATYHFASADNRDKFLADPGKYTPIYGGYCSLGITMTMKIDGDPQAWNIVDDKLYINSSPKARTTWSEDIPGNIVKADGIWPTIEDKDPAEL